MPSAQNPPFTQVLYSGLHDFIHTPLTSLTSFFSTSFFGSLQPLIKHFRHVPALGTFALTIYCVYYALLPDNLHNNYLFSKSFLKSHLLNKTYSKHYLKLQPPYPHHQPLLPSIFPPKHLLTNIIYLFIMLISYCLSSLTKI